MHLGTRIHSEQDLQEEVQYRFKSEPDKLRELQKIWERKKEINKKTQNNQVTDVHKE